MYDELPAESVGYGMKIAEDRQPSAREQLTRKKQNLERQLGDVNAAIQALDDHPDVEKVLTLVGRTVRF